MSLQQREKIKPIFDVPLVLQMETVYGEETTSKFTGVEYRYNVLYEDRPAFIYLPAEGRDAIQRARPQVGDFIELLKQKRNGRVLFSAQPFSDAHEPPPQRGQVMRYEQPQPVSQPEQRAGVRLIPPPPPNWNEYEEEAPPSRRGYMNGHANGHGNGDPSYHGQAQPPRPEASELHPITQQMAGCLRWSFDAWEELRRYAVSKGRQVDYSSEDIRATANTLYMRGGNSR